MLYLEIQEVQAKWERTSMRDWSEIYQQFGIVHSTLTQSDNKMMDDFEKERLMNE